MRIDYRRAKVFTPEGEIRGRFVYQDGAAAVLVEDRITKHVTRPLYSTSATFNKAPTARYPHTVTLADTLTSDGQPITWEVRQLHGGNGCGCKGRPAIQTIPVESALAPDFPA